MPKTRVNGSSRDRNFVNGSRMKTLDYSGLRGPQVAGSQPSGANIRSPEVMDFSVVENLTRNSRLPYRNILQK
ncbi:unnamed protein product [Clonostachys rosea]|uniref:Uncharacterized protein n=1 Tax=Bionectria ochroleuca TaxID=29856 RepID=A0ABY6UIX1_BIOOC|nr:unnamed protein product [Clonostachys rosea]